MALPLPANETGVFGGTVSKQENFIIEVRKAGEEPVLGFFLTSSALGPGAICRASVQYPPKIGYSGTSVICVDCDGLNCIPFNCLNITIWVLYRNLIFIRLHDVLSLDAQGLGAFTLLVPPPGSGPIQEAKKIGHVS